MSFTDKKVCLVLSCDRPYYTTRRELNSETYKWFQTNGFSVVFLFADPKQDTSTLILNLDGSYTLRVPSLECYELLSHKMELAYKYFNNTGCSGILKIDDDIKILDKNELIKMVKLFNECDYYGITIGRIAPPTGSLSIRKYTLNLFKNLKIDDGNLKSRVGIAYAGGPFYWVSAKTINYISKEGLEYIYEDASVGNIINNHPELVNIIDLTKHNTVIAWDNDTELV
jgi:hypothetical protein